MEPFRWAYVGSGCISRNIARDVTRGGHVIRAVCSRSAYAAAFAIKYGRKAGAREGQNGFVHLVYPFEK